MTRNWLQLCAVGVALIFGTRLKGAEVPVQYNRDIRPILSDRCFRCHGPDARSRKAKLRLDDSESAFGPRKDPNEHALVAGHPEQSVLIRRIFTTDPDDVMPPPSSHLTLSDSEKETLRKWVAQGAKYEPHWAFVPLPARVAVPEIKNKSWARNEIDNFIAARLEKAGIKPSREASKTRWLRRVTYDLNGLPPTPAEVDAFQADKSTKAYEKVVDRLLASPHYGERMAAPWLDAARYADSYGYRLQPQSALRPISQGAIGWRPASESDTAATVGDGVQPVAPPNG
jgi:mono/diheme cytochrome c family protein